MTSPFSHLTDTQLLALCIDRESRGEPYPGRVAVGSVVLNRANWGRINKSWGRLYGDTIKSVVLSPAQFSWTIDNRLDKNHLEALEIAENFDAALKEPKYQWLESGVEIAQGLISGEIKIITSALYYHEIHVHPSWAKGKTPMTIGKHIFYI